MDRVVPSIRLHSVWYERLGIDRKPPNTRFVRPVYPKPSGGWVAKERIPAVQNFDNCVSIQVRRRTPPTPDLQAEE